MDNAALSRDVRRLKQTLPERPEPVARPVLVLVSGLPGTGKSYFSQRLAERLPGLVVESDDLRKKLFGTPGYSAAESQYLFRVLHRLVEELLDEGTTVVLDATNLVEHQREYLYRVADRRELKLIVVRVEAPPEVVRERLRSRAAGLAADDRSDADWEVYQRMSSRVERISRNHFVVDTSRDISPVLPKIVREAQRNT